MVMSTVHNQEKSFSIPNDYTGYQLKQYIFNSVTNILGATYMKLYYAGVQIKNDKKMSEFKMTQGKGLKVIQSKASIDQIPGLIVAYQQDQISCQTITARMPCGHVVGRDCMTQFIRSLIQNRKTKIVCPSYNVDGERCQFEWPFALCRKVGVFTNQQNLYFQQGLSKNWIRQNTIQCPNCQSNLFKGDLKMNRVNCPQCETKDFCVSCLKPWNSSSMDLCGNQGCKFTNQFLQQSPWDVVLPLQDKNSIKTNYSLPRHRACVGCSVLIQHDGGCKHMACQNCQVSFCWVCLSVCQNGIWKCGSYTNYCGKIQQVQKLKQS